MEDDLEIKISRELVYTKSTDYLDDLIVNKFATSKEKKDNEYIYPRTIDKGIIHLEATMVPISTIRKMLLAAENKGANFVSIDFHCDHGEYDIYGLKVKRASTEVIDKEEEKKLKFEKEKKQTRIIELEKELKELKD